jgi:hypothetical protein
MTLNSTDYNSEESSKWLGEDVEIEVMAKILTIRRALA